MTNATPERFQIRATDAQLSDLNARLRAARWPNKETVDDWSQGVPLGYLQEVVAYWANSYDWRAREARINAFPQFRLRVGGLGIHFIHARSSHADALPLIMTHGWPGSIVEFLKVIEPLTEPQKHGGEPRDAFHVVCPSLPGYGFSDQPAERGCGVEKIAELWDELMCALGYSSYVAQGGDWGAAVTTQIASQNRGHCRGIHLNIALAPPTPEALANPTAADQAAFAAAKRYGDSESGYSIQQTTRPQTVGYGLADSPVGQAAWILEKFWSWTDCDGLPENAVSRDELLDNVMMYWLSDSAASSARLYWESFRSSFNREGGPITLPMGCSNFPKELAKPPRSWVERRYKRIVYWNDLTKGGHFAAFEQPATFVNELRACFRLMRS